LKARDHRGRSLSPAAAQSRGRSDWKGRLAGAQQAMQARRNYYQPSNPRYAPGHDPYGTFQAPAYGPVYAPVHRGLAAPLYYDARDYADIYYDERYYEDGPNGPGFYRKDRWYNWY